MLANPHWDAPSLSSFEHWLESKDPNEKYKYCDCLNCACAQYLKHIGQFNPQWLGKANPGDVISRLNGLAAGSLDWSGDERHTFGDLLSRVRKQSALTEVSHAV